MYKIPQGYTKDLLGRSTRVGNLCPLNRQSVKEGKLFRLRGFNEAHKASVDHSLVLTLKSFSKHNWQLYDKTNQLTWQTKISIKLFHQISSTRIIFSKIYVIVFEFHNKPLRDYLSYFCDIIFSFIKNICLMLYFKDILF